VMHCYQSNLNLLVFVICKCTFGTDIIMSITEVVEMQYCMECASNIIKINQKVIAKS